MKGQIIKIEENITTILTDNYNIIEVNTLFLPLKYHTGDSVDIEGNKIVIS